MMDNPAMTTDAKYGKYVSRARGYFGIFDWPDTPPHRIRSNMKY